MLIPDAQYVKRIRFAAAAIGDRGARLDDQRFMSLGSIPVGRMAGVTQVKVSGKNNVHAAFRKCPHGAFGAANQVALSMLQGKIKWVMTNDDFRNRIWKLRKFFA